MSSWKKKNILSKNNYTNYADPARTPWMLGLAYVGLDRRLCTTLHSSLKEKALASEPKPTYTKGDPTYRVIVSAAARHFPPVD